MVPFCDYLTRLPSVTITATMIANANVLDRMSARLIASAFVVCGSSMPQYYGRLYTYARHLPDIFSLS